MTAQVMALPASTAAGTASKPVDTADPPPMSDVARPDVVGPCRSMTGDVVVTLSTNVCMHVNGAN